MVLSPRGFHTYHNHEYLSSIGSTLPNNGRKYNIDSNSKYKQITKDTALKAINHACKIKLHQSMIHTCSIRQVHIVCVTYRKQCNEVHVEPFLQRAVKHPKLGCNSKQNNSYLSVGFETNRTICINAMYNVKKFIICKSIYAEYLK